MLENIRMLVKLASLMEKYSRSLIIKCYLSANYMHNYKIW